MIEKITGFLADNALTQSWARSVDSALIRPVEKMFVDDGRLKEAVYGQIGHLTPDEGPMTAQQLKMLSMIKGSDVNAEALQAGLASANDRERFVQSQALAAINKHTPSREQLLAVFDEAPSDGRLGLTQSGDFMRQWVLGSPVAAYAAVGAGGALGTAGAMEAYDWWMAQQQQAEKDRALPLEQQAQLGPL